jgi:hypothetical protein
MLLSVFSGNILSSEIMKSVKITEEKESTPNFVKNQQTWLMFVQTFFNSHNHSRETFEFSFELFFEMDASYAFSFCVLSVSPSFQDLQK